jgi:hypothetical protein
MSDMSDEASQDVGLGQAGEKGGLNSGVEVLWQMVPIGQAVRSI